MLARGLGKPLVDAWEERESVQEFLLDLQNALLFSQTPLVNNLRGKRQDLFGLE